MQLGLGRKLLCHSVMPLGMLLKGTSAFLGFSMGSTCEERGAECGKLFISSIPPSLGPKVLQEG